MMPLGGLSFASTLPPSHGCALSASTQLVSVVARVLLDEERRYDHVVDGDTVLFHGGLVTSSPGSLSHMDTTEPHTNMPVIERRGDNAENSAIERPPLTGVKHCGAIEV